MRSYLFHIQRDIRVASMALHHYIRRKALADPKFLCLDQNPDFVPYDIFSESNNNLQNENPQEVEIVQMNVLKDQIAYSLMKAKEDINWDRQFCG